jgi:uncharacterized membrane protein YdjX (TVP38/TMEM64 family)
VLFAALVAVLIFYVWQSGLLADIQEMLDQRTIARWVDRAGVWGPLIVVGLMTVAVVASPLPSAPIAIAAGAAYGHTFGTIYVVAGAFLGAMIAFALARWLGRNRIKAWFGQGVERGLLGSQNALTITIFIARLIPFVSFDMISYAAGLSIIKPVRFAIATFFGVVPTAFLMTHIGEMAVAGDSELATWASVIIGVMVVVGLAVGSVQLSRKRSSN